MWYGSGMRNVTSFPSMNPILLQWKVNVFSGQISLTRRKEKLTKSGIRFLLFFFFFSRMSHTWNKNCVALKIRDFPRFLRLVSFDKSSLCSQQFSALYRIVPISFLYQHFITWFHSWLFQLSFILRSLE